MTKLNNAMHRELCRKLIKATFADRELRLLKREHALAVRALHAELGPAGRSFLVTVPATWLPLSSKLNFEDSDAKRKGSRIYLGNVYLRFAEATAVPAYIAHSPIAIPPAVRLDVLAFLADEVALYEEREQLDRQVTGTLGGFTTVEKLAADWPEGYAYSPHPELASTTLPAVRLADLNARLDAARAA